MPGKIQDLDILWLGYDGIHPAHRDFAESIGAEVVNLTINSDPGWSNAWRYIRNGIKQDHYDYVICNEGPSLRSGVPMKLYSWINPRKSNTKVVRYLANANYYFISQNKGTRPYFNKFIAKFVDGAMANSEFTKENGEEFIDGPIRFVYPPIRKELYELAIDAGPDLESGRIVSMGYDADSKGIDMLVEAFDSLEGGREFELVLLGSGLEKYSSENIVATGRVENVVDYLNGAELFVQPSRGDGFGVAPLEAMLCGVNSLVTDTTGSSAVVSKVDSSLVCQPNVQSIKQHIEAYLGSSKEKKECWSEKSRNIAKDFDPEEKKQKFRDSFQKLIGEIEQ